MHKNQDKYSNDEFDLEELNFIDQMLRKSLEDDFEVSIPLDFADQVTELIEKRKSIREALLKHLMMSIGLLVILAFTVAFLYYFRTEQANIFLKFILNFKYPLAFGLIIITAIQLADSFLLSRTKDQLGK
jgi:formate/nitrite transporter FocA (FNT family)